MQDRTCKVSEDENKRFWYGELPCPSRTIFSFQNFQKQEEKAFRLQEDPEWGLVTGCKLLSKAINVIVGCTVFNKFGSTAIKCPRSLQILYCQKKLFCTLQRIHSSFALLPDYLVKKSLQFWRGLNCSMQASVFQLCKKTAKIAGY